MIKAIVCVSNTGHAQRYGSLLSAACQLPCYTSEEAKTKLHKGEEIIFLGWMCAGAVKGYEKAAKTYCVKAVCGVGLRPFEAKILSEIKERHKISDTPVFYVQGGLTLDELHGINKMMFSIAGKALAKAAAKPDADEEAKQAAQMFTMDSDYVSAENLTPLVDWYHAQK